MSFPAPLPRPLRWPLLAVVCAMPAGCISHTTYGGKSTPNRHVTATDFAGTYQIAPKDYETFNSWSNVPPGSHEIEPDSHRTGYTFSLRWTGRDLSVTLFRHGRQVADGILREGRDFTVKGHALVAPRSSTKNPYFIGIGGNSHNGSEAYLDAAGSLVLSSDHHLRGLSMGVIPYSESNRSFTTFPRVR